MGIKTRQINVGGVLIGGGVKIPVQSMTNTPTEDFDATLAQIRALQGAGCDIARLTVPNEDAARAFSALCKQSPLPLVADIHFDYKLAIAAAEGGASKIRVNPGNIGSKDKIREVAKACAERNIPIRIGVNGGSLEKDILDKYGAPTAEALVESAARHVELLNECNFDNICISLKSSDVKTNIAAYRLMHSKTDYPLHLGVTEAGTRYMGTLKSAAAFGSLLLDDIGDTIRVSLTADPVQEIYAAKSILKAIGMNDEGVTLISCPTCGRTKINLIELAERVEIALAPVKSKLVVAVMGCVVNGPGEAREADLGVAGGNGEGLIFARGEIIKKVPECDIERELLAQVRILTGENI